MTDILRDPDSDFRHKAPALAALESRYPGRPFAKLDHLRDSWAISGGTEVKSGAKVIAFVGTDRETGAPVRWTRTDYDDLFVRESP